MLAYPIQPASLPYLYFTSDYIVIARIDNPEVEEGMNISYDSICMRKIMRGKDGDGLAYLNIIEVLKGNVSQNQILVDVPSLVCPTPPHYTDGNYVLAFLNKDNNEEIYKTTSLAWGAIEENYLGERINSYKLKVQQLSRISRLRENKIFGEYYLEFLVQCCEDKIVKWDGIYSMIYQKDQPKNRYDYDLYDFVKMNISSSQKQRIENVFINSTSLTKTDLYFLCFLSKQNKLKAANKILNSISNLNLDDYDIDDFMEGFFYLYPSNKLIELYDDFSYFDSISQKENTVKSFLKLAKDNLNGK